LALVLAALQSASAQYNDPPITLDPSFKAVTFSLNGHPYGITSLGSYVYQWDGNCLYKYSITAPLPTNPTTVSCNSGIGGANYNDITVTQNGRMYHSLGWEMDPNTGLKILPQAFTGVTDPRGIAGDPRPGRDLLYISTEQANQVYIVRGIDGRSGTLTAAAWGPQNGGLLDGLIVGPDGTVYVAGWGDNTVHIYYPDDDPIHGHGQQKANLNFPCQPDGMAAAGDNSYFVVACTNGIVNKVELLSGNYGVTQIADTGIYNDFATVASDGCLYGSTNSSPVYKITNADGSCSFTPTSSTCPSNCNVVQKIPCVTSNPLVVQATATFSGECVTLQITQSSNPASCS